MHEAKRSSLSPSGPGRRGEGGGPMLAGLAARPRRAGIILAAAMVGGMAASVMAPAAVAQAATASSATPPTSLCPDANLPQLGPWGADVCVFTPEMSQSAIQADLDNISNQQVPTSSQFDSNRYAIFFEPGTYGSTSNPLIFEVGYYTEVAGLGWMPSDTVINGEVLVPNTLCSGTGPYPGTAATCNADDNFWRSLSNVQLNVTGVPAGAPTPAIGAASPNIPEPGFASTYNGATCYEGSEMWAASQADPLRRDIINGTMFFQDYCSPDNYASGGFIADSEFEGTGASMQFDGNQQYIVRNTVISAADGCAPGNGGLWNNVFVGDVNAPPAEFGGQCDQNTVVTNTPVEEEAPFIYQTDSGGFDVFAPAVQTNSSGPSWINGTEAGISKPISDFLFAAPDEDGAQISALLNNPSKHYKGLILLPGVYNLTTPITVDNPNQVIMGLGFATLVPQDGNSALVIDSNYGVKVDGIIVDAGPVNTPNLVQVGTYGGTQDATLQQRNPDLVSDLFFRIGGAETTDVSANTSFVDYANYSIIDDMWAWRADHGAGPIGWTDNVGDTGVVVNANNVTAYGLAVEHYQQNETVWNGNDGTVMFFQNELPYDVPSQSDWMETPTQDGYPAFLLTNGSTGFSGYGMGSYVVFIDTTATLYDAEAFESPQGANDVFNNVFTVYIGGSGGDQSVIDGTGGPDTSTNPGNQTPEDVTSFS